MSTHTSSTARFDDAFANLVQAWLHHDDTKRHHRPLGERARSSFALDAARDQARAARLDLMRN